MEMSKFHSLAQNDAFRGKMWSVPITHYSKTETTLQ